MRLHDLTVGQRFSFRDKHRGKVFEVTAKTSQSASRKGIQYKDVATGEIRNAWSHREMFRKEVDLETDDRTIILTPHEVDMVTQVLHERYLLMCEGGFSESSKTELDKLFCKITGHPGRRVVLPEGEL